MGEDVEGGARSPSITADVPGGGLIWGRTPACRAGPILTHVKRKGSRLTNPTAT